MKKNCLTVKILQVMMSILVASALIMSGGTDILAEASAAILKTSNLVEILDDDVPLADAGKMLMPSADGKKTFSGGGATIDASNASEGYIMVKISGSGKIKLQITKSGKKTTYTYDLKGGGKYQTFPLTAGKGKYTVKVFKNVSGNQYAEALSANVDAAITDSLRPFMYPSQYVDYTTSSAVVKQSNTLASGAKNQLEIVTKVYKYVIGNISYDTQKAKTVKSGYLPEVDKILSAKKGICFDYAAVMASMLRAQKIPTRLEVGYVSGNLYHAWISVYIKDVGWIDNAISFDGKSWKLMDPTFASSGGASQETMKFIGNGTNYSVSYMY